MVLKALTLAKILTNTTTNKNRVNIIKETRLYRQILLDYVQKYGLSISAL